MWADLLRSLSLTKMRLRTQSFSFWLLLAFSRQGRQNMLDFENLLLWKPTFRKTWHSQTGQYRGTPSHKQTTMTTPVAIKGREMVLSQSLKHTLLRYHWYQRGKWKWLCWWAIQHLEEKAPGILFWWKSNIEKPTEAQMLFFVFFSLGFEFLLSRVYMT